MVQSKKDDKSTRDTFRDHLATIDEKGKRVWVFAKKPKGKLTTYRNIVGLILLVFLFAGPFIKINGNPLLLLNFIDRKFVILGTQFWPQDFHLFFMAMLALFVFIILFTVTYGRVWCGWTCPQTVFTEILFRRIEYWIEGSAHKQKALSRQKWNFEKIWKKTLKQIVFFAISFLIGNTFLAYIIGIDALKEIVTDDPANQISGLVAMFVFSGIFYFIFSYFREQVCTIVCPYGRLQGVLLDKRSIVVAYDYVRGESRGSMVKGENRADAGRGDCIDCTQCVQVCPTGIDIRNGTQLECINCTTCIDACNSTMKSIGKPKGLIRYASEKMIAEGTKMRISARTIAYSGVLFLLIGLIIMLFFRRADVETTILRAPGMLYQEQADGRLSNLYNFKLLNKTCSDMPVVLKLVSHQGEIQVIGEEILVKEQSLSEHVVFVYLNKEDMPGATEKIVIGIYSDGQLIEEIETSFIGPNK
ncbi:MAG: cytochrome c oxidase accessory protein CcoG [Bacteroidetes bacterium]|nr:MAG: cytochrome c oxidase accessory protein CcoG [Bacteroidota bacterium]